MSHRMLLRGRPGIGKTTIARRVLKRLVSKGVSATGFVTDEIRDSGTRVGFRVEATSGASGVLAHVDFPGPIRVGKYGVDLVAFEEVAVSALAPPYEAIAVIDELGPMELASDRFVTAAVGLFEAEEVPVVATVHARRHPFTDLLIGRNDTELVEVTVQNRDALPDLVVEKLTAECR